MRAGSKLAKDRTVSIGSEVYKPLASLKYLGDVVALQTFTSKSGKFAFHSAPV